MLPSRPIRLLSGLLACLGLLAATAQAQNIRVLGNDVVITEGDSTPSTTDHTDFGNVDLSVGVADRTFTVQNLGFQNLFLFSIQPTGGASNDFSLLPPGYAQILPPNTQTTFTMRFNPTQLGLRSTIIRISNNDPVNFAFDFTVRGNGTLPAPEINVQGNGVNITDGDPIPTAADHTDFGSVDINGAELTRTFTIQNTGDSALQVDSIQTVGGDTSLFTVLFPPSVTIPANLQTTFDVRYNPTDTGLHSTTIRINNNDANEPTYDFMIQGVGINLAPEIGVEGNGLAIAEGDSTPSSADHTNFSSSELESNGITRSFSILNNGIVDLEITSIRFIGGNSSEFAIASAPISPIPSSTAATFEVLFQPTAPGLRSSTIRIASNDTATPFFDFAVHGFGGSFKLLRIDRDNDDAIVVFFVNPDPGPSTYIYSLEESTDPAAASWLAIEGINTSGGGGERSFRVANAFARNTVLWRITEVALP